MSRTLRNIAASKRAAADVIFSLGINLTTNNSINSSTNVGAITYACRSCRERLRGKESEVRQSNYWIGDTGAEFWVNPTDAIGIRGKIGLSLKRPSRRRQQPQQHQQRRDYLSKAELLKTEQALAEKPHYTFESWGPRVLRKEEDPESAREAAEVFESEGLTSNLNELVVKRTTTFEDMLLEGTVGAPNSLHVDRLVNQRELKQSHDLWRYLLVFQRRVRGDEGVLQIWNGMRNLRSVDLPTEGKNADIIWPIFISVGLRRPDFLLELYKYVIELDEREGRYWARLYDKIIGDMLVTNAVLAVEWHKMLYPKYQAVNWREFFLTVVQRIVPLKTMIKRACFHRMREIHSSIIGLNVYDVVIPYLAEHSTITEAMKCHTLFMKNGDLPQDTSPANLLFQNTAMAGTFEEIREIFDEFTNKQIPFAESTLITMVRARERKKEMLEFLFKNLEAGKIPQSALGDDFWATLFLDPQLNINAIIEFMGHFGIKELGKISLSALLVRANSSTLFEALVRDMKAVGIKCDHDILDDVFFEWKRDSQRTEEPESRLSNEHYNQLLLRAIHRKQIRLALRLLTDMRAVGVTVQPNTLTSLIFLILRPRRKAQGPKTMPMHFPTDDLTLAMNVLMSCLRTGSEVPYNLWREIFKRLGKLHRLDDVERLSIWLVSWYNPIQSELTRKRLGLNAISAFNSNSPYDVDQSGGSRGPTPLHELGWERPATALHGPEHDARNPAHPLRKIFPPNFIRSIVEWGFLSIDRLPTVLSEPGMPPSPDFVYNALNDQDLAEPPPITRYILPAYPPAPHITISGEIDPVYRLHLPEGGKFGRTGLYHPPQKKIPDITWGIRLALHLSKYNVDVNVEIIRAAVCTRARALYGGPERFRSELNLRSRKAIGECIPPEMLLYGIVNKVWRWAGRNGLVFDPEWKDGMGAPEIEGNEQKNPYLEGQAPDEEENADADTQWLEIDTYAEISEPGEPSPLRTVALTTIFATAPALFRRAVPHVGEDPNIVRYVAVAALKDPSAPRPKKRVRGLLTPAEMGSGFTVLSLWREGWLSRNRARMMWRANMLKTEKLQREKNMEAERVNSTFNVDFPYSYKSLAPSTSVTPALQSPSASTSTISQSSSSASSLSPPPSPQSPSSSPILPSNPNSISHHTDDEASLFDGSPPINPVSSPPDSLSPSPLLSSSNSPRLTINRAPGERLPVIKSSTETPPIPSGTENPAINRTVGITPCTKEIGKKKGWGV